MTPNQVYPPSWHLMQGVPTAWCAGVLPFMFTLEKAVNVVGEWHSSQVMPTVGTCVAVDGAVGDPPAASGVVLGW